MGNLFIICLLMVSFTNGDYVITSKGLESYQKELMKFSNTVEQPNNEKTCRPLTIPACKRLGYNSTRISTDLFYSDLYPYVTDKYLSLLDGKRSCSEDLLFLVCTILNPICFKDFVPHIKPCRSVCHKVKDDCSDVLEKLFVPWPSFMDCEKLPSYETNICIAPSSLVQKKYANLLESVETNPPRKCKTCRKTRRLKRYRQFERADYAFEAKYLSKTTTSDNRLKLKFFVKKVFKSAKISTKKFAIIEIWTKTPCLCQTLTLDNTYIMLGRTRFIDSSKTKRKYLLNQRTIIEEKTRHLVQVLKRWAKQSASSNQ